MLLSELLNGGGRSKWPPNSIETQPELAEHLGLPAEQESRGRARPLDSSGVDLDFGCVDWFMYGAHSPGGAPIRSGNEPNQEPVAPL